MFIVLLLSICGVGSLVLKFVFNVGLLLWRIGVEMMLLKEEVDCESLRGEFDDEVVWLVFFLWMKMKVRMLVMINIIVFVVVLFVILVIGGLVDCGIVVVVSVFDGFVVVDGFDVGVVEGFEDGVFDCEGVVFWLVFMIYLLLMYEYLNG